MNPVSPFSSNNKSLPSIKMYFFDPVMEDIMIQAAENNRTSYEVKTVNIDGVDVPYNRSILLGEDHYKDAIKKEKLNSYAQLKNGEKLVAHIGLDSPNTERIHRVDKSEYLALHTQKSERSLSR